jgi:hypothetical protein
MIWQDFMYVCAGYPEEEWFLRKQNAKPWKPSYGCVVTPASFYGAATTKTNGSTQFCGVRAIM